MKKTVLLLLLAALPMLAAAQTNDGRWVLGGSLGLGISDTQTAVNISPQIGYRVTDYLTVGGGPAYAYYKYKHIETHSNYLGMNAYARINPIQYLQVFVQPEVFNRWGKTRGIEDDNKVFATLLVGGGVLIPVVRGGIVVSVYYDVIQDDFSPYRDEVMYSVGYAFYF